MLALYRSRTLSPKSQGLLQGSLLFLPMGGSVKSRNEGLWNRNGSLSKCRFPCLRAASMCRRLSNHGENGENYATHITILTIIATISITITIITIINIAIVVQMLYKDSVGISSGSYSRPQQGDLIEKW